MAVFVPTNLVTYVVTSPTGLDFGRKHYAKDAELNLTVDQAQYLVLSGSIRAKVPFPVFPNDPPLPPVTPVETNTFVSLLVSGEVVYVSVDNLLNLFPKLRPQKGEQGEQGDKGDEGEEGPKGDKGDEGDVGPGVELRYLNNKLQSRPDWADGTGVWVDLIDVGPISGAVSTAVQSAADALARLNAATTASTNAATSATNAKADADRASTLLANAASSVPDPLAYSPAPRTLDYILTVPGAVPPGQFSRLSTGYRVRSSGLLESVAANVMRIAHDPITGETRGALIEEQRTNSLLYSEQLDNAAYTPFSGLTVSADSAVAPDGTSNADALISTGAGFLRQTVTVPNDSLTRTVSIHLKAGTVSQVLLNTFYAGGTNVVAVTPAVNLTAGTISGATGAVIQALANGWYRVSWPITNNGQGNTALVIQIGSFAAGTIFAWGAQLEVGTFPTSYIPTIGAATRTADSLVVPVTSDWLNPAEGVFYFEGRSAPTPPSGALQMAFELSDGTAGTCIRLLRLYDNTVIAQVLSASAPQATLTVGSVAAGDPVRIAFSYAAGNFAASMNGAAAVTAASGSVPSGLTTLKVGDSVVSRPWNSAVRRIAYIPRRLDNATLQKITA